MTPKKLILDVTCGSRMCWFNKKNPYVEYCDNRIVEPYEYYPGRYIEIAPDTVCDFTELPYADKSYKLVLFDPPHVKAGKNSWLNTKYGSLTDDWRKTIQRGFHECFRVMEDNGVLIFKWSEVQIPLKEILKLSPEPPLFGHRSGKHNKTHWVCFMKLRELGEK